MGYKRNFGFFTAAFFEKYSDKKKNFLQQLLFNDNIDFSQFTTDLMKTYHQVFINNCSSTDTNFVPDIVIQTNHHKAPIAQTLIILTERFWIQAISNLSAFKNIIFSTVESFYSFVLSFLSELFKKTVAKINK